MAAVTELAPVVGVQAACAALGVPKSSFYRRQRPLTGPAAPSVSARSLRPAARESVLIDVFSRYVVGWMVAYRETAELARQLIASSCHKQNLAPGQLTVHADRGSSMTSQPVALLMADLGVTKTHSRPYVSDDNPYSESHFRTLKYRPDFPERFGSIQDSRSFCQQFFAWYNQEHRHSGIELLTPAMVHYGQAPAIVKQRQLVLDAAYQAHPERFVRRPPQSSPVPKEVWINKPPLNKSQ
jgi:putative transposase